MPASIDAVAARQRARLQEAGLTVADEDLERPWGGFLVLAPQEIQSFIRAFFPDEDPLADSPAAMRSPKLLLVAPGLRLSWQYHRRRSEVWRVLEGPVAISRSRDDTEPPAVLCSAGELVRLALGERHRLSGLEDWGVVAEIWEHGDPSSPSDEQDIVRVADDHVRAAEPSLS